MEAEVWAEAGGGGGKLCLAQGGLSACLSDGLDAPSCDQGVGATGWLGPELRKC